jgi:aconitase A
MTVDHSIATEVSGRPDALRRNVEIEYARNAQRYRFLKWGERLDGMRLVPPGTGIMHQINLEHLATVVQRRDGWAFPDTCVGTDSHTTMINALGVLAWGVGGVEAEVVLLGQPLSMVLPPVVGVELVGELAPTVTATDLVLTIVERLRTHGVVGTFVEFTGSAVARIPLAHRATIANMCPEFGATTAMFPIDDVTLDYLRLTGRKPDQVATVETSAKEQGLWYEPTDRPRYDETLRIDLTEVTACLDCVGLHQNRAEQLTMCIRLLEGSSRPQRRTIKSCACTQRAMAHADKPRRQREFARPDEGDITSAFGVSPVVRRAPLPTHHDFRISRVTASGARSRRAGSPRCSARST